MRALNATKEILWRAAEWSFVMAALCCLFARAWTDPACGTQRRVAKRNDSSLQQRTSLVSLGSAEITRGATELPRRRPTR